jgi:hypothetical protein
VPGAQPETGVGAAPTLTADAPRLDWYQAEAPLGRAAALMCARLVRRAGASWRVWVSSAVLAASLVTLVRARTPPSFEVTIMLRVVEGAVEGPALSEAEILAQVEDLAFTKERLLALMRKHVTAFPRVLNDQSLALDDLQDRMKVEVSEDDFIEDRQPTDPRRSARVTLSFKAPDPQLAWDVANELKGLLVDSGLERQRDRARWAHEAATAAVKRAELDVTAAMMEDPGGRNKRLEMARARLLRAQQEQAEAGIASRATAERLALRFDVIDPGRFPPRVDRRTLLAGNFATALFVSLLAFAMLSGAYDPRVLDVEDLSDLGPPVLGHVPRLVAARDGGAEPDADREESRARRRRV